MIQRREKIMVTRFGRFCRNIRMENGKLLYDMAAQLGVSSAFLSRVENGRAKPPIEWENIIRTNYELSNDQCLELKQSMEEARNGNVIKIDAFSDDEKDMMFAFARKLDSMDKSEKDQWKKMLRID